MNAKLKNRRLRATGLHFLLSLLVAGLASLLVFLVWYPTPYASIAGGLSLFALLVSVDVVLGPALTAVVANPTKPLPALWRDLACVVLVQVAALAYGLYTIALARPVYMAFEVDRFRIVTAADIEPQSLSAAPAGLRTLPWFGPELIAAVKPTDPDELMRSVELAMRGFDLSMIPRNWRNYSSQSEAAWRAARPASLLLRQYPQSAGVVAETAAASGVSPENLRFLPLQSRQVSWVALIAAPEARIVGYLPLDGFF